MSEGIESKPQVWTMRAPLAARRDVEGVDRLAHENHLAREVGVVRARLRAGSARQASRSDGRGRPCWRARACSRPARAATRRRPCRPPASGQRSAPSESRSARRRSAERPASATRTAARRSAEQVLRPSAARRSSSPRTGRCRARARSSRRQHDHRDRPPRVFLVLRELRDPLGLRRVETVALGARSLLGEHRQRLGADLDRRLGVGLEVVVPAGFSGAPAFEAKIT